MTDFPNPAEIRTVAIRLTNWVGDCVMNTPFLARTRALFPGARIVCLGRKSVTSLLQGHPHVDEVWTIEDQTTGGFLAAAKRLRELKADIGFLLPNSIKAASLFVAGNVRHRIGYDRDGRRMLLTHPIDLRPEDLAVHEVRYYLHLLHGWETESRKPDPLRLHIEEAERDKMRDWLAAEGIGPDNFLIGVNPAALYGSAKRWPADRYAEAARLLAANRNAKVVVTGLPQERDVAQLVCDAGGEGFVNGAGKMSLRELMAFIERCNIYLTNDSGAMHIAAALRTPLIAVFGSTDWVTTAPLSPWAKIVRRDVPCAPCILRHCPIDHRCMNLVTAPMVVAAAEDLLSRHGASSGG